MKDNKNEDKERKKKRKTVDFVLNYMNFNGTKISRNCLI